ncbi:AAA family ATPase [Patulibacter americanus]|uniref:AAA family ATPase n=1 Tax=Patulibacter americanus TaxID=588672 RepID=UPI0003B32434|nr:AAA family ATPase [Patulibacter americanus]
MLEWLDVEHFRAFGARQRLEFSPQLTVVSALNSQGKTSLAEAIEFLFSGALSRQRVLSTSKTEYAACLQNAHHPGQVCAVSAAIGSTGVLRRELVDDYGANSAACKSRATFAGADLEETAGSVAGLLLGAPPIIAPVLHPHTLRFPVSAGPTERFNYLRAAAGLADLELVRERASHTLKELAAARKADPGDLASKPSAVAARTWFVEVSTVLGKPCGVEVVEGDWTGALEETIRRAQEATFPFARFEVQVPESPRTDDLNAASARLVATATAAGASAADSAQILHVAHSFLHGQEVPFDCPVCGTADAITAERIAQIEDTLRDLEEVQAARTNLAGVLDRVAVDLAGVRDAVARVAARMASIAKEPPTEEAAAAVDIDRDALKELLAAASVLRTKSECHAEVLVRASAWRSVDVATSSTASLIELADRVRQATDEANDALVSVRDAAHTYRRATGEVLESAKLRVTERGNAHDAKELLKAVREAGGAEQLWALERAHVNVAIRAHAARQALLASASAVVSARHDALGHDVRRWWSMLRPGDPTTPQNVVPRGRESKHIDLLVELSNEATVRTAVGVLSDSQLNALGLALALARAAGLGWKTLVLDDPTQGGDDEHRAAFVNDVVPALLKSGVQVTVLTHDPRLAADLLCLTQFELAHYSLSLAHDATGATVAPQRLPVVSMLASASHRIAQAGTVPTEEDRRAVSHEIRIVAERVAKTMLVRQDATDGDTTKSLSSYANAQLGDLIRQLRSRGVIDPQQGGEWDRIRQCANPGSHDDIPRTHSELVGVFTSLRASARIGLGLSRRMLDSEVPIPASA